MQRFFQRELGFAETAVVFNLSDLLSLATCATTLCSNAKFADSHESSHHRRTLDWRDPPGRKDLGDAQDRLRRCRERDRR